MRRNASFNNKIAVAEIVGGVILLLIAIISFSVLSLYLYPPPPDIKALVKIEGTVDLGGQAVLKHMGGETLTSYKTIIRYPNGTFIGSKENKEDNWDIGEKRYPCEGIIDLKLTNESVKLWISVFAEKNGKEELVFDGILSGRTERITPIVFDPGNMLVPSLNTSTTDEDLICFTNSINSSLNVTSYIFKWLVNGGSLSHLLLPFDSENNSTAKDYSGNGFNGTIKDAKWTPNGKIGGAYYFDGGGDHIEVNLPTVFDDLTRNDFTLCTWIYSKDVTAKGAAIFEASIDKKYFVKMWLSDSCINFGVCENDARYSVKTETLQNDVWYHIAGVWDASAKSASIYLNGSKSIMSGDRNFSMGTQYGLSIGRETASSRHWWGYIDEFQIFNFVLSDQQIYQLYLSQKDGASNISIIVSEETDVDDIWQCIVYPNDGIQDDEPTESNLLQIVDYPGGE